MTYKVKIYYYNISLMPTVRFVDDQKVSQACQKELEKDSACDQDSMDDSLDDRCSEQSGESDLMDTSEDSISASLGSEDTEPSLSDDSDDSDYSPDAEKSQSQARQEEARMFKHVMNSFRPDQKLAYLCDLYNRRCITFDQFLTLHEESKYKKDMELPTEKSEDEFRFAKKRRFTE